MDASTHGPVLAGEAVITAIDGTFRDSVRFTVAPVNYNLATPLAFEREGSYLVQARVTGYQDWAMEDIRVRGGGCHVETRTLYAHLDPARLDHLREAPAEPHRPRGGREIAVDALSWAQVLEGMTRTAT